MTNNYEFPTPTLISGNGVELEVFEAGQKNGGQPIVLCHGWPEHAFSWRHQVTPLVEAGYHVIIPNQRGYGKSSCPKEVTKYDIEHLTGDLVALLDHYQYKDAIFMGHDWGASVVWSMALLHPERVNKMINLCLPYQVRGERPWIDFMEEAFGDDYYFVHFNKQPGVADAVLDENAAQFLRNLYRKNVPSQGSVEGMEMINLAKATQPLGEPVMSDDDLSVYITAFNKTGFTPSINWYRNLNRNWDLLGDVSPILHQPTLMIYGEKDIIPPLPNIKDFVPNIDIKSLNTGHWIQEERPEELNQMILEWLEK
ncbi:alpha/beta hydrolase [Lysinibacillus sp. FSL M8-0216]|uniref:Pimeloyl-ACP methyl ester carboxylesterase n=1 Tax=Lysinibacillus fusiformis TaxID=28031 RepID=A0A1H9RWB9_9BACI|nr:alpha/beta hydrolase [Lysinibacillus fusiformis]SCX62773.1 Pimeloyl-ACP methyl ester carboxylesterase [Lysinibacillus fusiformis]SCY81192.1 Pimeloyl-ACP methyl ester carboxylesterase [Lysinibacillus fusiformis]SDB43256.1 Pimeloyl-ACP methyl ester carboxylesterase [Lysinibacillus fusiformis]SEO46355.1 Pimeloyl-ACP methyl ester carboxylesterase [Lysinibacillus fusiformis]SER76473.1 Pimeloyl-ACP methyl ester carboxylesterase [Lysinibacillus fusiformis]